MCRGSPVAQHGDPVGDLADLAEPMGDVDDRRPFRSELPDRGEEKLDGVLRSGAVGSSRISSFGETANALASSSRWRRATLSDETRSSR